MTWIILILGKTKGSDQRVFTNAVQPGFSDWRFFLIITARVNWGLGYEPTHLVERTACRIFPVEDELTKRLNFVCWGPERVKESELRSKCFINAVHAGFSDRWWWMLFWSSLLVWIGGYEPTHLVERTNCRIFPVQHKLAKLINFVCWVSKRVKS